MTRATRSIALVLALACVPALVVADGTGVGAAKPAKTTCRIDGAEVRQVVYEAFVATLVPDEKSRESGETPYGGFASVDAFDATGHRHRIREQATKTGFERAVSRDPEGPAPIEGGLYHIDRTQVGAAVYRAFRASLKAVPGTADSGSTPDYHSSSFTAVAKDGSRYRVREDFSTMLGSGFSITREATTKP